MAFASIGGDFDRYQQKEQFDFAQKKFGREGREVPIVTNFCPIKVPNITLYHYNIEITVHDFIREKDDKNVPQRNRILQQKRMVRECNFSVFDRLIKQETSVFSPSSEPIFDGSKNLYSKAKLNIEDRAQFAVKHKIPEKKFPIQFDVVLTTPKDSHELNLGKLNDETIKSAEKELQAVDIILQYGLKKYKVAVGSNFRQT